MTASIEQALLESHCERKGEGHRCAGVITIRDGKIDLACVLCGSGDGAQPLPFKGQKLARAVMEAAGVRWECLSIEAQRAAAETASAGDCPGCGRRNMVLDTALVLCACEEWICRMGSWRRREVEP